MGALETISQLKEELDSLRPLPRAVVAEVEQKLRLESLANASKEAIQ